METFNNLGGEHFFESFSMPFFCMRYFSAEHFDSCKYFSWYIKSMRDFRCLQSKRLVPITARHVFLKKIIFHYYIK